MTDYCERQPVREVAFAAKAAPTGSVQRLCFAFVAAALAANGGGHGISARPSTPKSPPGRLQRALHRLLRWSGLDRDPPCAPRNDLPRPGLRPIRHVFLALLLITLGGCALFTPRDPLNVQLAGIQPLPGEGLELRMAVKLRVQNPNDTPLAYHGIALELEVNGRRLASGVSDQQGSVPRFGEALLSVPMTLSAFNALRQALGLAEPGSLEQVPYVLRGKLAGGAFGTRRFSERGTLDLSPLASGPYRRP